MFLRPFFIDIPDIPDIPHICRILLVCLLYDWRISHGIPCNPHLWHFFWLEIVLGNCWYGFSWSRQIWDLAWCQKFHSNQGANNSQLAVEALQEELQMEKEKLRQQMGPDAVRSKTPLSVGHCEGWGASFKSWSYEMAKQNSWDPYHTWLLISFMTLYHLPRQDAKWVFRHLVQIGPEITHGLPCTQDAGYSSTGLFAVRDQFSGCAGQWDFGRREASCH